VTVRQAHSHKGIVRLYVRNAILPQTRHSGSYSISPCSRTSIGRRGSFTLTASSPAMGLLPVCKSEFP